MEGTFQLVPLGTLSSEHTVCNRGSVIGFSSLHAPPTSLQADGIAEALRK